MKKNISPVFLAEDKKSQKPAMKAGHCECQVLWERDAAAEILRGVFPEGFARR